MQHLLNRGKWERPTDKMAVYTEIESGKRWGIRVTLLGDSAVVEAIDGPKCSWYAAPKEVRSKVGPASLWERLKGINFEKKLMAEVEAKRLVARIKDAAGDRAEDVGGK
ncbi:MAG TPA: hypothetical protein VFK80_10195 [Limnochordia bacterium]|nr:hypothetical protein [Limnochordia bacterium]